MSQPNDPLVALSGEVIALRSIVGTLVAFSADRFGDREKLIRAIVGIAEETIDRADIDDADPDRAERIREAAHHSLLQALGVVRGSGDRPR